jgi:putative thioredoxin
MSSYDFIVNVSESNFDYEVIAYSQQIPVVVDFWANWCAPCKVLGPILEKIAKEYNGEFRLAKVDIDQNPNLANRFNVRSIPSVKAFKDNKLVSEFMGALPEPKVREFIQVLVPGQDALILEKGKTLLGMKQGQNAEIVFRQVLEKNPQQPAALLGLTKSLLLQGQGNSALTILNHFPVSRELSTAEMLRPLTNALVSFEKDQGFLDDPLMAAFQNALRLVKKGNLEAAMDGILDILRQDKNSKNGEVRRIFLSMLELLPEDSPETRNYRNELASILF